MKIEMCIGTAHAFALERMRSDIIRYLYSFSYLYAFPHIVSFPSENSRDS